MRLSVVRCARRCPVKKTLFATTLVLALTLTAAAQRKPAASQHLAGSSDENTLLIPNSSTYAAFNVPSGVTAGVTGILVNVQADVNFDPQMAGWDIRTGVSEGNGGTSIASGTNSIMVAATGRNFIGLNE